MENSEDSNKKKNVVANPSVEGAERVANALQNFSSHDVPPVTSDPREKVAKEREYYDAKENPGRNYNINDQAYSQSSAEDFTKTVSKFHHADGENSTPDKE